MRISRWLLLGAAALLAVGVTADPAAHAAIVDASNTERQLEQVAPAGLQGDGVVVISQPHLRQLKKKKTEAPEEEEDDEEEEEEEAPKKKKKKTTSHPAFDGPSEEERKRLVDAKKAHEAAVGDQPATSTAPPAPQGGAPAPTTAAPAATTKAPDAPKSAAEPTKVVNDKRIKGNKQEGVIDHSSEGSAEIDKIDLRNEDGWVSVYNDPPLLVIKASLYAFISYNNSKVCDAFNMTLNAVEQKPDGNGTFEYHVVTYVNCTKNNVDETPGRFILNFVPEGRRLLLTECGHREENEIVNWLKIKSEVPECMTPGERREFLAQPMKHIHAANSTTDAAKIGPTMTNFLARLEALDPQEVAIAGSATVALIAVVAVIVVFVLRKRKAQKDLERTIAGAKADHADEDDDKSSLNDDDDKKKKKSKDEDEDSDSD